MSQSNQVGKVMPWQNPRGTGPSNNPNFRTSFPTCNFCEKKGHEEKNCWRKAGKCLVCGSLEHFMQQCPQKLGVGPTPLLTSGVKRKASEDDNGRDKPKEPARVLP